MAAQFFIFSALSLFRSPIPICGRADLRYFQVHLAFNACKEILILWPGAKAAKAQSRDQKAANKNKFHKGLDALHWRLREVVWRSGSRCNRETHAHIETVDMLSENWIELS